MDWKGKFSASEEPQATDAQATLDAARKQYFDALKTARSARDTGFFEGREGFIHPIRGTKGYSRAKAGDPRKHR